MQIKTPRLMLRPYEEGDVEEFVAINTDADVRRHVGGVLTREEALNRFLTLFAGRDEAWAITLQSTGQYIGHCWLVMRDHAEMGLLLIRRVWRQGYGSEVAVAVLDHAFTQRRYPRVIATVDGDHPASIGVLERAGMRRECEQSDAQGVYFVYAATKPGT